MLQRQERLNGYKKKFSYKWNDQKRIKIIFNNSEVTGGSYTNTNPAQIKIGTGAKSGLENLNFDNDVVVHEFFHHIIFPYLSDIEISDSLPLQSFSYLT